MVSAVMPQQQIGLDAGAIREWAVRLEELGLDEIELYEHVLGADPSHWIAGPPPGFSRAPYTTDDAFHEPLILFSHLAAVTRRIGLATSILVLPQRQTALVAKQCAELDNLSGGRLRLGVGVGWNEPECRALGEDFTTRGARIDEQIEVLRMLWAEPVVTYDGRWHGLDRVGINPRPVRGSIPIWIGGMSRPALRRVARSGDGWATTLSSPDESAATALARLDTALSEVGRARGDIEVSAWMFLYRRTPEQWASDFVGMRELGIDRVSLITLGAGAGPKPHLQLIEQFMSVVGHTGHPAGRSPTPQMTLPGGLTSAEP